MQVRIYVTPRGVQRVFVVSSKKKPTVDSLAFYAAIEEPIERFKEEVRKCLSAQPGRSRKTGEQGGGFGASNGR